MNVFFFLLIVPFSFYGQEGKTSRSQAQAIKELLELHDLQRTAHLNRDARLLVAQIDENFVEARNGKISFLKKADLTKRFQAYFGASTFIEWDDIKPPIIKVSHDATLAHLIVNKRVRLKSKDDKELTNVFAWISTFQKIKGKWLMTSIASTVQP